MKSWKEYPHLFAGGGFQVRETVEYNDVFNIQGFYRAIDGVDAWLIPSSIDYSFHVDNCTLIARRIESMDSEELLEAHYIADSYADVKEYDEAEWLKVLKQWAGLDDLSFATARQLISIGVYPGPPGHFNLPDDDPAKVIDTKQLG